MGENPGVIACFYDCDQTLIPEYMQDPMLDHLGINPQEFWAGNQKLKQEAAAKGIDINSENSYMINLIFYINEGKLPPLSNADLQKYGRELIVPYPGLPEFFIRTKEKVQRTYGSHSIKLEHYIISTGLRKMIQGSSLNAPGALDEIFASEFLEVDGVIALPARNVGFIEKTKYLYEASKGTNVDPKIDVNKRIPYSKRRIPFENMIYVGDGFTDVPCMTMIRKLGGQSIGVYDSNKEKSQQEVLELLQDRRVDRIAQVDYRQGGEAAQVIEDSILRVAERILREKK